MNSQRGTPINENQYPTGPEDFETDLVDRIREIFNSNQRGDPIASRPTMPTIRTHTHEPNILNLEQSRIVQTTTPRVSTPRTSLPPSYLHQPALGVPINQSNTQPSFLQAYHKPLLQNTYSRPVASQLPFLPTINPYQPALPLCVSCGSYCHYTEQCAMYNPRPIAYSTPAA